MTERQPDETVHPNISALLGYTGGAFMMVASGGDAILTMGVGVVAWTLVELANYGFKNHVA